MISCLFNIWGSSKSSELAKITPIVDEAEEVPFAAKDPICMYRQNHLFCNPAIITFSNRFTASET